jgi:hypothetical protein
MKVGAGGTASLLLIELLRLIHVGQIDEEVVGQRDDAVRQDTLVLAIADNYPARRLNQLAMVDCRG